MLISTLADRGPTPALVKTMAFAESRLRMIGENVANIHTPGYRAKQLDVKGFQRALREAINIKGDDPAKPLVVSHGLEVTTDKSGFLQVTPSKRPTDNILFHDGTNLSIEREMADLAETGMTHELAATMLRNYFDGLRRAIRGTV